MRKPNEIDFWRGFALITIFVNHIPGNFIERFSYRNISLSDSAELFVLLAGWSMRLMIENPKRPLTAAGVVYKLWGRAFTLYIAQTFITEFAIFILAAASIWLDAPFLLDWHNAGAVFHEPLEAHIGLVLLTHQLGYFNILPLYVVLMVAAPIIALIYRTFPQLLLPLSLAIYVLTLTFSINLPSWPIEGTWFFSPTAWQLIYVIGFLLAGKTTDVGAFARRHIRVLRWIAVPIVLAGVAIASTRYFPGLADLPKSGRYFVIFDKTFMSPDRFIHMLALCALFAGAYASIYQWMPQFAGFLAMLGRNALNVFCAGSLLSLCGQIVRFIYGGQIVTDVILFVGGVAIMAFVAWISEWRSRTRKEQETPVPALPAPSPFHSS
jgi:hypothetical protein